MFSGVLAVERTQLSQGLNEMSLSVQRNREQLPEGEHQRRTFAQKKAFTLLDVTFILYPLSILSLLAIIIAYALGPPPIHTPLPEIIHTSRARSYSDSPPTLQELLSDVADALDSNGVTFWLMPGTGLLPVTDETSTATGRLAPWREGVDLGVNQSDLMNIILAQTALQPRGIVTVESYYGLRLFPLSGHSDDRYDYNIPFVDLVYFQSRHDHFVNYCCDCEPIIAGVCTKKTCGCLVCAARHEELFPLNNIRIEGMLRGLPAPHCKEGLFLPTDIPEIHPELFQRPRKRRDAGA